MIGKQVFRTGITIFLIAILLCPSFGMLNIPTQIIWNVTADYVDASNNTNCIEEDHFALGWSKDIILSKIDQSHSNLVDICIDKNDVVHVVWEEQGDPSYTQIYYSMSSDYGNNWSEGKRVTNPSEANRGRPSICCSQSNILHLVWVRWMANNNREVYYIQSDNGGLTWDDEIRLTTTPIFSVNPKITSCENNIYLVWTEKTSGGEKGSIWFRKSNDNGNTWLEPMQLTHDEIVAGSPSVYVHTREEIYVVWQAEAGEGFNVQSIKSLDGGYSWSSVIPITNKSDGVAEGYPNPEITGTFDGSLHVVWADETSPESKSDIAYSRSLGGGNTWTTPVMLTASSILTKYGNSGLPSITSDKYSNLYIMWTTSNYTVENDTWIATSNDVYFTYSVDDGVSWADVMRLTQARGWGRIYPVCEIDSKRNISIVWGDGRFGDFMEICYKRSLNPVTEPPIVVTQSLNVSICKPRNPITVSGNAVYDDSIVPNANVSIKILETGDEWITTTDSNGNYSKTITAPSTAGNYTIRVTVTSGNHTGWKQVRLIVEQESTNGDTTNGGQPNGEENKYGVNLNYVIGIIGVIAICIILGVLLVKRRGKTAAKTTEKKTEKNTMNLRCPKCRQTFKVEVKPKPFNVKCPHCGKEGTIGAQPEVEPSSTVKLRCPGCKKFFEIRKREKPFNVKCPHCGKEGVIK